jgi:predicted DNA-binding transcriptional regulator YafY
MATGYEKINKIKCKLRVQMTVSMLAQAMDCGPRTIFRHLNALEQENCGLHKFKKDGETFYVIQTEQKVDFNQKIVKQLEKLKKTMNDTTPLDLKNRKLIDSVISSMQTTDPDGFKAEAITVDPNYIMDYGPFCDHKAQDTMVSKLLSAIRDGFKIRMVYRSTNEETDKKTIEVSPVKLVMRIDTLYLIAADETYPETHVFKNYLVENILSIAQTNNSAITLREPFCVYEHYKYAFGKYVSKEDPQTIELLIKTGWLKTQFIKSRFSPCADITEDKDKNMIVTLKLRMTPDFKTWLFGVLPDVKILKPESLRTEMIEKLKNTLKDMKA